MFISKLVFFRLICCLETDIKAVLKDETVYNEAAADAFPSYNKSHMICLQLPNRSGDVMFFLYSCSDLILFFGYLF